MREFRALLAAAALLVPGVAWAERDADSLFKQGKTDLAAGRYADACDAFAQSYKLDPAIGTQLNLALCFEQWGKIATAYEAYLEAERLASVKGDKRAAGARQRVDALAPRVPKLVVQLPAGVKAPVDLEVTLDGKPFAASLFGSTRNLDPGEHTVTYRFGEARDSIELSLDEGASETVTIPVPEPTDEPDPDTNPPPDQPRVRPATSAGFFTKRRVIGLSVAGAGAVAASVGGVMVLGARSDYRAAFDRDCTPAGQCNADGFAATSDARSRANTWGIIFGVGMAAVATGAIVMFTGGGEATERDTSSWYLVPAVGPEHAGLALGGAL